MKKSRIVLFGGAGFIGSHLSKKLLQDDFHVTIFTRLTHENKSNLDQLRNKYKNKIQIIIEDFSNSKLINEILQPKDIVFDLISSTVPFTSMQSPLRVIQEDIFLHENFIKIACEKRVKKIIFPSSGGGIYGENQVLPICEEAVPKPSSPYAIGKLTIEYFLRYYAHQYQVECLIYRISNPYGPNQLPKEGFALIPTIVHHIQNNTSPTLFNYGKLIRDFIYIDDLIDAIAISFNRKNKHEIYNIGSGKGVKIKDVWALIKDISHSKVKVLYKEKRIFDIDKVILDISRFKNEFSWKPKTSLSSGLTETLKWMNVV